MKIYAPAATFRLAVAGAELFYHNATGAQIQTRAVQIWRDMVW